MADACLATVGDEPAAQGGFIVGQVRMPAAMGTQVSATGVQEAAA